VRYVVIMAGGSGTRLWPLSRQGMPKQLLRLIGGRSLLRLAYDRALSLAPPERILVCASDSYTDIIEGQLPGLPAANLLGEPVGRDSLSAVAWSMATVALRDPSATVAVLSADHVITPAESLRDSLEAAFESAEADPDALIALGVPPIRPHTGYGYLRFGQPSAVAPRARQVLEFAEKPNQATAEAYLAAGDWWWNSGMFCWRVETWTRQLERLKPATAQAVAAIVAEPERLGQIYPELERISLDYAIMEPVSRGATDAHVLAVPLTAQWGDIGGFPALAPYLDQLDGNAVMGRVVCSDSQGNLIVNSGSDGSLVAVVGLKDTVVVIRDNITLVCPLDRAEDIKGLVETVRAELGDDFA
jgi:mannose-1-phosphate guanylyltransferase